MQKKISMLLLSLLTALFVWGYIIFKNPDTQLSALHIIILSLIIIVGIAYSIFSIKHWKEDKEGQPRDDELSMMIKYKTGYLAYKSSMYMWMLIFLVKDRFPSNAALVGSGILMSALMYAIFSIIAKRKIVGA